MLDLTDFEVLVSSKPKPYTITFNKNGNITLSKELSEDISSNIESATAGFRLHYSERERKLFLEFVDMPDIGIFGTSSIFIISLNSWFSVFFIVNL